MEPAKSIIKSFGGAYAVAEIVNVHVTRVYKWQQPKEKGGTDGVIPINHAICLRDFARDNKISVSEKDFFPRYISKNSGSAPSSEAS